jgi:hypothetical protein
MGFQKRIFPSAISLLMALIVAYGYSLHMDVSLTSPEALVGIATLKGVDVGQRIHQFYLMLLVAFFGFLLSYLSIRKWIREFHPWTLPLVVLGIFLGIQAFIHPDNFNLIFPILGVSIWIQFPVRNEVNRWKYLLVSVSFTLFLISFLAMVGVEISTMMPMAIGFFALGLTNFLDKKTSTASSIDRWAPLVLLPLVGPVSEEIFLILNQHQVYITTPLGWFIVVSLVLVFVGFWRKSTTNPKASSRIFRYGFVLSGLTFLFYTPFYKFWGDFFELANPAHSVMRHFVWGEWPFVDYFSSHVLSEQIPQWIYVVLNGYSGEPDFMTYTYFINIAGGLIGYWFFSRILRPNWGLAIVFLFPFTNALIPPTFILGLLTLFFAHRYFMEKKPFQLYGLLLWLVFITFWRIDFGASIIPAITILFMLDWMQSGNQKAIFTALLQIGGFALIFVLAIALVHFATGEVLFHNVLRALDYLGASQAHGYEEITKSYTTLFFLHYYVFPVVSVGILVELVISGWRKENSYSFLHISVLFLGLVYLFNAQRGLVRHGFNEDYDLYISSVFFLFISTWILTWFSKNRGVKFIVFGFLVILGFHFPNVDTESAYGARILNRINAFPTIKNTHDRISRMQFTEDVDQNRISEITEYITTKLDSGETFIDLTHSPMWYFFTQKRIPSYFNQYMQNLVTPRLQKENVGQLDNIGLVIFGHSPRNPLDILDGVPNELRYLYITEYVYAHFSPAEVVNGYRMWWPSKEIPIIDVSSDLVPVMRDNLYKLPEYLGRTENFSKIGDVIMDRNEILLFEHQASVFDAFEITFWELPEEAKHSGWIQYFDHTGDLLGEVEFEIGSQPTETKLVVPIGYQYLWNTGPISRIQLFYPDYLRLKNVQLVAYEP